MPHLYVNIHACMIRVTDKNTYGSLVVASMQDYPRSTMGYAFEFPNETTPVAAERVLGPSFVPEGFDVKRVCMLDSTEIDEDMRATVASTIAGAPRRRVIVTHGAMRECV